MMLSFTALVVMAKGQRLKLTVLPPSQRYLCVQFFALTETLSSLGSGLNDVDILPPDGLLDLDHGLAVSLVVHRAVAESNVQMPANDDNPTANVNMSTSRSPTWLQRRPGPCGSCRTARSSPCSPS